jgi:hypothetical protein
MQASTIRSDIIGTGHVPGDDLADAALALDDPFGLDGGIEVEVDGKHLCALAAEERRRCLAVAPTRTARTCSRNQRYLLLEPIAHALLPKQLHREITLGPINGDGGSAVRERDLRTSLSPPRLDVDAKQVIPANLETGCQILAAHPPPRTDPAAESR